MKVPSRKAFTYTLMGVAGVAVIFAMLVFGDVIPIGKKKTDAQKIQGEVTIWGTFPSETMSEAINPVNEKYTDLGIRYVEIPEHLFESRLLEAAASGFSPDLIFVSQEDILTSRNRLSHIPYENYPVKNFRDNFVDGSLLFARNEGLIGLPIAVDPLVMYYNRQLLRSAFISRPPQTWNDFIQFSNVLTIANDAGEVSQSAVALGGYDNISHAKEILTALDFQAGGRIIKPSIEETRMYDPALLDTNGAEDPAMADAIDFYAAFANPSNPQYSWNPSLLSSRDSFLSGRLATYFGFASELGELVRSNPNLDLEVDLLPQIANSRFVSTYGKVYALAIPKLTRNQRAATVVLFELAAPENSLAIANAINMASAHRTNIGTAQASAHLTTFNNSAIISQAWLDPNPAATNQIFRNMVTRVTSGAASSEQAVSIAADDLKRLLP